jgi:hypothetical protein
LRPDVQASKDFGDLFIPQVKRILIEKFEATNPASDCFAHDPNDEQDRRLGTDIIVLSFRPYVGSKVFKVGYRCRDAGKYLKDFFKDITFRYSRPNGRETEFQKIIRGHGDYFFYGFGETFTQQMERWIIVALAPFRSVVAAHKDDRPRPWSVVANGDGSSEFAVFKAWWLDKQGCVPFRSANYFETPVAARRTKPKDDINQMRMF